MDVEEPPTERTERKGGCRAMEPGNRQPAEVHRQDDTGASGRGCHANRHCRAKRDCRASHHARARGGPARDGSVAPGACRCRRPAPSPRIARRSSRRRRAPPGPYRLSTSSSCGLPPRATAEYGVSILLLSIRHTVVESREDWDELFDAISMCFGDLAIGFEILD